MMHPTSPLSVIPRRLQNCSVLVTKVIGIALVIALLWGTLQVIASPNAFAQSPTPAAEEEAEPELDIFEGPTSGDFRSLNPLTVFDSPYARQFSSPAGIINRALLFAFPIAGLILFVMIVYGGFEMLLNAANKKGLENGRQRITAALVGFILLFSSFWIMQIIEFVFKIAIL